MRAVEALAAALLAALPAAVWAQSWRPPMTEHGHPDLQGTWTNAWLQKMERGKGVAGPHFTEGQARVYEAFNARGGVDPEDLVGQEDSEFPDRGAHLARIDGRIPTSWVFDPPDGKIPWTEEMAALRKVRREGFQKRFDDPEGRPLSERCLGPAGPPIFNGPDLNHVSILQTADHIVIHPESSLPRIVRLGGTHHPEANRFWQGDAIGRWEGQTLVIESARFHPLQVGAPPDKRDADTRVVERFTRIAPNTLRYSFTVENPVLYKQPWRGEMVFRTAEGERQEFACHEGNYAVTNILGGGRRVDADDVVATALGLVSAPPPAKAQ